MIQEFKGLNRDTGISLSGAQGPAGSSIKFKTIANSNALPAVGVAGTVYVSPDRSYIYERNAQGIGGWNTINLASKSFVTDEINRIHNGSPQLAGNVYLGALATPPTLSSHPALKVGDTYFNTTNNRLNIYDTSHNWKAAASEVSGQRTTESFIMAAGQTDITLAEPYDGDNIDVHMNGRLLTPIISYRTVADGSKITLNSPARGGERVVTTAYGTFTVGGSPIKSFLSTIVKVDTDGQTNFTVNYVPGNILVFVNGMEVPRANFVATNGTTIQLTGDIAGNTIGSYPIQTGAVQTLKAGDELEVVQFNNFLVSSAYTKEEVNALLGTADVPWETFTTPAKNHITKRATKQEGKDSAKLGFGEFAIDNYQAGTDRGAVWVGGADKNKRLLFSEDKEITITNGTKFVKIEPGKITVNDGTDDNEITATGSGAAAGMVREDEIKFGTF